jgi:hypothetical protein
MQKNITISLLICATIQNNTLTFTLDIEIKIPKIIHHFPDSVFL